MPEPGPAVSTEAPALPEAQGFDAKGSKEVASARKEQQRTYRNPDSTYTTRFYNEPVNYQGSDGAWRPIDTTLKRRDAAGPSTMSVGEDGWETASTEEAIAFTGTADADPVVRMQVGDGMSIAYGMSDARTGTCSQSLVAATEKTFETLYPSTRAPTVLISEMEWRTIYECHSKRVTKWLCTSTRITEMRTLGSPPKLNTITGT